MIIFGNQIVDDLMQIRIGPNGQRGRTAFSWSDASGFTLQTNKSLHGICGNAKCFGNPFHRMLAGFVCNDDSATQVGRQREHEFFLALWKLRQEGRIRRRPRLAMPSKIPLA
jgi:hypothetical protein